MTKETFEFASMDGNTVQAYYDPNYGCPCSACDYVPTVRIRNAKTDEIEYENDLCGACFWGEADCADPAKW